MQVLRNGAVRVDERRTIRGEILVLAYWEGRDLPWVTWRMDGEGHCYWGHYFKTLAEAAQNLEVRVGGNLV